MEGLVRMVGMIRRGSLNLPLGREVYSPRGAGERIARELTLVKADCLNGLDVRFTSVDWHYKLLSLGCIA